MRFPKSLTLHSRFIRDAAKSPNCERILKISEMEHSVPRFVLNPKNEIIYAKASDERIQPTTPETAPSTVLLGLILGMSLCFPKSMPPIYAKVSVIHAHIKGINMRMNPYFIE